MSNPLVMKFEHPRYLSKFAEYCLKFTQHANSASKENEAFNKACWEYAIFTHAVISKNFFNALSHLEQSNNYLELLNQNLKTQEDITENIKESAHNLQIFTRKVQDQYQTFLEKKKPK